MQIIIETTEKKIILEVDSNISIRNLVCLIYQNSTELHSKMSLEEYQKDIDLYTDNFLDDAIILDINKNLTDYRVQIAESNILNLVFTSQRPEIPNKFICPLSALIFLNPVQLPCGTTVERQVIDTWINAHGFSPFTRQPLTLADLIDNQNIKTEVGQFFDAYKDSAFISQLRRQQYMQEHGTTEVCFTAPSDLTLDDLLAMGIESHRSNTVRVQSARNTNSFYDHIFIDEAQDYSLAQLESLLQSPSDPTPDDLPAMGIESHRSNTIRVQSTRNTNSFFDHIFVDEAQDYSLAQLESLLQLAGNGTTLR